MLNDKNMVYSVWKMSNLIVIFATVVRTLTGHRSSCNALQFHPFGEFFASGSSDTSLKIWDVRKKGCIHTYKGHIRGVSTIKFSPDGRWVVSGGADNIVKVTVALNSLGKCTFSSSGQKCISSNIFYFNGKDLGFNCREASS